MAEYTSNVLIEADMLIDTDIGVIRLIDAEYCDTNLFFKSVTSMEGNKLKGLLKNKTLSNPLQVIFKDESDTELMDGIYNQFMNEKYKEVIYKSVLTSIFELLINFIATEGTIVPTIVYKKREQEIILSKLLEEYKGKYHIVCDKDQLFDVAPYTEVFVKDIRSLVRYKNLHGKTLFIADMMMNIDRDKFIETGISQPPESFYKIYMTRNKLKYISLYKYDDSFFMQKINSGFVRGVNPSIEQGFDDPFIQQILGKINPDEFMGMYNKQDDDYSPPN